MSSTLGVGNGEAVVVMDNEDRENEGDLIFAAEKATPELLAFTIRYSSGYICVGMHPDRLDELDLPLMVKENMDPLRTQYTVSVDASEGVSTGISAADRAKTIRILGDYSVKSPGSLRRPGHVLPLRARKNGVLERGGHTEAAIDLTRLAGLNPAGALCELVNDDGTMKRRNDCIAFVQEHGLKMVTIIEPAAATDAELTEFHSEEYIECLLHPEATDSDSGSDSDSDGDRLKRFGLLYDCPVFEGMEDHVRMAAGGTLTAAACLIEGSTQVAMHWEGGRHHGQRSRAAGFCYINDVVLGILKLQGRFGKVLYIDLDLHHGDGVQGAFQYSNKVMTLSIHHCDRGFYPNTGRAADEGKGRGIGHSINAALRGGASDATFKRVFGPVASAAVETFEPGAVVVQCGCDGLAGDPHKIFNLTAQALADAVQAVLAWKLPTLLLGGGGYSSANAARCWTRLTAVAAGEQDIAASEDIPEHAYLNDYAPAFDMATDATLAADDNTEESTAKVVSAVLAAIKGC
ncbi:Histone deacetylase 8 [Coemansia spiralis]|uniref:Histone deacetylase 8 n=1 Tax=Coemansia spiralis TaxID=417178 RepID=A0A9W8GGY7_9FUNG|nr:Histone deacetylase 8 [Coemansia spiralis]